MSDIRQAVDMAKLAWFTLTPVDLWVKRDIQRLEAYGFLPDSEDFSGPMNPIAIFGLITLLTVVFVGGSYYV